MCKEVDAPPPKMKEEIKPTPTEPQQESPIAEPSKQSASSYSTSSTSSDYSDFSKSSEVSISGQKSQPESNKDELQRTLPPVTWKDPSSPFLFPDPAICSKSVRGDDLQQLSSSDEFSENSSQKKAIYPDTNESSCDAKYERILLSM